MEVMHERVAGLDVHKATIVACVRIQSGRQVKRECRTFSTTTDELQALLRWLTQERCSHVAMEATGVYWKPVWHILSDGEMELILVNAAHVIASARAGKHVSVQKPIANTVSDARRMVAAADDARVIFRVTEHAYLLETGRVRAHAPTGEALAGAEAVEPGHVAEALSYRAPGELAA